MDDFFAFISTTSDGKSPEGGAGVGCLRPILYIVAIIIILTLLGQCSG